jgi:hypothetical protein
LCGGAKPLDERQDLATASVDAQKARRAVEPAALEVGEQPVNPGRTGLERPADRVADAHHPRCMAAGERHLPPRAIHSGIIACSLPRARCTAGSAAIPATSCLVKA